MRQAGPDQTADDRGWCEAGCDPQTVRERNRIAGTVNELTQRRVLPPPADAGGQAHQRAARCDALSERQLADPLQERHGDHAAADSEEAREEADDAADQRRRSPQRALLGRNRLGGPGDELADVDEYHVDQEQPEGEGQEPAVAAIEDVAQLDTRQNRHDPEGEHPENDVPPDRSVAKMAKHRGEGNEQVDDHGGGLREMLIGVDQQLQRRDHQDRAADTQQAAQDARAKTENAERDEILDDEGMVRSEHWQSVGTDRAACCGRCESLEPTDAILPPMSPRGSSEVVTEGVCVAVRPFFMPEESLPGNHRFVFGYRVEIRNDGPDVVRLVSRRWQVIDGDGREEVIEGPGVIGETPRLEPGQAFRYTSYVPLETPWGTMEGSYEMRRDDGSTFRAAIGRFYLMSEVAVTT